MTLLEKLDALLAETEKATPFRFNQEDFSQQDSDFKMNLGQIADEANSRFTSEARTDYPAALRALKVAVDCILTIGNPGIALIEETKYKFAYNTIAEIESLLKEIK